MRKYMLKIEIIVLRRTMTLGEPIQRELIKYKMCCIVAFGNQRKGCDFFVSDYRSKDETFEISYEIDLLGIDAFQVDITCFLSSSLGKTEVLQLVDIFALYVYSDFIYTCQ